jgi:hypothetical protein
MVVRCSHLKTWNYNCKKNNGCGDDGHILLSTRTEEDLREISDHYKQIIKPLYDYTTKHSQKLFLYSASGKGFGNPKLPTKGSYQMSSPVVDSNDDEFKRSKRPRVTTPDNTIYPYLEVNISIKNSKTHLVHYRRLYEIENISDEPICEVIHGIATDGETHLMISILKSMMRRINHYRYLAYLLISHFRRSLRPCLTTQ